MEKYNVFASRLLPKEDFVCSGHRACQGCAEVLAMRLVHKAMGRNTIAASRELGRNEDKVPTWENMLAKMPDYMIDDDGIIKEWLTPRLDNRDSHRHSSQLYPLFDGIPEEIAQSPELRAAFRKSSSSCW